MNKLSSLLYLRFGLSDEGSRLFQHVDQLMFTAQVDGKDGIGNFQSCILSKRHSERLQCQLCQVSVVSQRVFRDVERFSCQVVNPTISIYHPMDHAQIILNRQKGYNYPKMNLNSS